MPWADMYHSGRGRANALSEGARMTGGRFLLYALIAALGTAWETWAIVP